jgi:hypothetical protein
MFLTVSLWDKPQENGDLTMGEIIELVIEWD